MLCYLCCCRALWIYRVVVAKVITKKASLQRRRRKNLLQPISIGFGGRVRRGYRRASTRMSVRTRSRANNKSYCSYRTKKRWRASWGCGTCSFAFSTTNAAAFSAIATTCIAQSIRLQTFTDFTDTARGKCAVSWFYIIVNNQLTTSWGEENA